MTQQAYYSFTEIANHTDKALNTVRKEAFKLAEQGEIQIIEFPNLGPGPKTIRGFNTEDAVQLCQVLGVPLLIEMPNQGEDRTEQTEQAEVETADSFSVAGDTNSEPFFSAHQDLILLRDAHQSMDVVVGGLHTLQAATAQEVQTIRRDAESALTQINTLQELVRSLQASALSANSLRRIENGMEDLAERMDGLNAAVNGLTIRVQNVEVYSQEVAAYAEKTRPFAFWGRIIRMFKGKRSTNRQAAGARQMANSYYDNQAFNGRTPACRIKSAGTLTRRAS